jgi:hypothetical protein
MTLAPPPVSTPLPAIGLPPRLYIPLPPNAEPKSLNTRITRGENILTDSSRVVLAPSNGEITAITTAKLTNGKDCPLVELTTTETPPAPPAELAPPADLDAFIEALQQAGITIDRRTSPDLLAQLRLAAEKNPIDTILCNFLGEAPSRLNAALGAGLSTEIIAALQRLRELTGAQRCWIAADAAFAATRGGRTSATSPCSTVIPCPTPRCFSIRSSAGE